MPNPSLVQLLPAWLLRAGLTRAAFARAIEVDGSQVSRWHAGTTKPEGRLLPAICSALALDHREAIMLYEASGVALAPELEIGGGS